MFLSDDMVCLTHKIPDRFVSAASMSNKTVNKGYCKWRFEPLAMARYVQR